MAVLAIAIASWLLMVPTLWNAVVGYLVGTSIAVIGLYVAFILPVILRLRLGDKFEKGAWTLGNSYKLIDWIAIIWVTLICLLFIAPIAPAGIPWKDGFDWNVLNYAPLTVGGAFVLFGGWWILSAKNWFKGPVRMGTDSELEQLEEKEAADFDVPADTQYES